jgi:hypothetical protein
MKICSKCGVSKNIEKFYTNMSCCKQCKSNYHRERYKNNRKKFLQKYKETYQENKDIILERSRKYYHETKEKQAQRKKKYYQNNKQKCINSHNEYCKNRRKNDSLYRLKFNYRSRVSRALKAKGLHKKSQSTREMLGCSYEEFKKYLENKFIDGMSWENHGKWHVDHIIPLASAQNKEELEKLFHYTNTQPLWAKDNMKKSNKII